MVFAVLGGFVFDFGVCVNCGFWVSCLVRCFVRRILLVCVIWLILGLNYWFDLYGFW